MSSRQLSRITIVVTVALLAIAALWTWKKLGERAGQPGPHEPAGAPPASPGPEAGRTVQPVSLGRPEYATSDACRKCHADQHASWHKSYHRTMTQWATPQSVIPAFDVNLESRGRSYRLERRGEEFWVTMLEPQLDEEASARKMDRGMLSRLPTTAQRVVMTTGSHVAQTYWVESARGLDQVPWVYHVEDQQWIPNEDSFLLPPIDRRLFNRWNGNCVKCHTVGPMPGMSDTGFATRVAELGISCEACHGPGEAHIRYRERLSDAANARDAKTAANDPIVNPSRLSHQRGSQICGQCHSSHREANLQDWSMNGSRFRPGDNLESHVALHRPNTAETQEDYRWGYWEDGTCRTGGDELLGLIQSPCYQRGKLSCMSCHSLHNYASTTDQLKPQHDGNQACLQCHEDMRERVDKHTHHREGSSGSLCFNCHMPHITYALFKGIRSHQIDSPDAAVSARTGRPNACNLCHLDRTLAWTAEKLSDWYSQPPVDLSAEQASISSAAILALRGDAAQRVIAAWHFGRDDAREVAGDDWQAPYLAFLLDDPFSVVRYVSYRALKQMPGFSEFNYNFVANHGERRSASERALELWRQQGQQTARPPRPEILLDDAGQLRMEAVKKLRRSRDNRPIVLPE